MNALFLALNPLLSRHVGAALVAYRRQLRREGLRPPAGFEELLDALKCASTGQQGTDIDSIADLLQDRPVTPLLLTKADAAKALAVHERTVTRLIGAGELRAVHVRGSTRIPLAALEEYVAALESQESPSQEVAASA